MKLLTILLATACVVPVVISSELQGNTTQNGLSGGCAGTKWGCCGNCQPKGPDGECWDGGCHSLRYGCCPNSCEPALGPNYKGCVEKPATPTLKAYWSSIIINPSILDCNSTTEGITKYAFKCGATTLAKSPSDTYKILYYSEPCHIGYTCIAYINKVASEPSNSVGSFGLIGGCAGTRWGCCPDGCTAAKGPDDAGCPGPVIGGCAGTRWGCCPDGCSYATGPYYAGCFDICLLGWHHVGKHCYRYYRNKLTYADATAKCSKTDGGVLVSPKTEEDNDELVAFVNTLTKTKGKPWLGLKASFFWPDGTELAGWTNWNKKKGTPNTCLVFEANQNFQWMEKSCKNRASTICQTDTRGPVVVS